MRTFFVLLVLLAMAAGGVWYYAGTMPGPTIEIVQPTRGVGRTGQMVVEVAVPRDQLRQLKVSLEQEGVDGTTLFDLADGASAADASAAELIPLEDRMRVTRPIGKQHLPDLRAGQARIVATAARPVLFGLREVTSTKTHEFEVRLIAPQVSVLSRHHYINHGGSEMVVYRVSADATSGVRVGNEEYPGFPASGAGIAGASPDLRVAFFALLWNQDPAAPISVFARDDFGNESHATFDYRVIPKKFRNSRIEIDARFLARIVPAILTGTPEFTAKDPSDLIGSFLQINRDLRRANNATIAAAAGRTAPQILWQGPFRQLANTAVEAGFADQRTYFYQGKAVDEQVHLGFDLASTSNAPVRAANRGVVVHAGWLGIYGNCVILDHGMGLQSLYAHLSSIGVGDGDRVDMGQELGRSGATGMAGGDHLHFTTLLDGNAVTPIDWWSQKWVQDRIVRKLREADTAAAAQ